MKQKCPECKQNLTKLQLAKVRVCTNPKCARSRVCPYLELCTIPTLRREYLKDYIAETCLNWEQPRKREACERYQGLVHYFNQMTGEEKEQETARMRKWIEDNA